MGREVRRVPRHWEHPTKDCRHSPWAGGCDEAKHNAGQCSQPLYDRDFEAATQEWLDGLKKWLESEFREVCSDNPELEYSAAEPYRAYVEWYGNAPDPEYYRPKWDESEAVWYQLYETVSEGTPVSPPFETKEELAEYLAENGDFWYQREQREGRKEFMWRTKPTIEQARSLVDAGWAMSGMIVPCGAHVLDAYEQQDIKPTNPLDADTIE